MDYGAKGDGVTDDTDAINNATYDGNRCAYPCESQTTTPAIVYFPPGTYAVSRPLVMLYYTQFIGDANNLPVILGLPNFYGIALLDSDPYLSYGVSWWANQNNMWRQVRNFVLDIRQIPPGVANCLHWQVAQGTSLQN
ncbi:pectin lyase-like protein, partial [Aureobasidium melanogenum]